MYNTLQRYICITGEVAAAIQRQESAAAAQIVVLAQQRLAAAKSNYAHQQRIAAAKEAAALQVSAKLAAAEITRAGKYIDYGTASYN